MIVLNPWLMIIFLIAFVIMLATGVFLWYLRGSRPTQSDDGAVNLPRSLFVEEIAEEIGAPAISPSPQPAPQPAAPELPRQYGVDRLILMARDPHWLYAYWEITATKLDEFTNAFGPAAWEETQPVLRVYDVTGASLGQLHVTRFIDVQVDEQADNWHIEVGEPDRSFCVDLGRRFPDGRFITLLRSNIVTTPRNSLSHRLDEEWMWIEGLYLSLSRYQFGVSSPMIIEEMALRAGQLPLGISSPGFNNKPDQDLENKPKWPGDN